MKRYEMYATTNCNVIPDETSIGEWCEYSEVKQLEAENAKYRDVLEKIANADGTHAIYHYIPLAKQALDM